MTAGVLSTRLAFSPFLPLLTRRTLPLSLPCPRPRALYISFPPLSTSAPLHFFLSPAQTLPQQFIAPLPTSGASFHRTFSTSVPSSTSFRGGINKSSVSEVSGFINYSSELAGGEGVAEGREGVLPKEEGVGRLAGKRKMKRIGTHNGSFHCDEALGCFMIRQTAKFRDAEIIRTRDQKILDTVDAVLDVGGVYDPSTDRFDHHQRGFDQVFGFGFTTKLSSAGLVYKHYGKEVVASVMGLPTDHPDVHTIYLAVYKGFMEAIDAVDNGISQYDTEKPPRYLDSTHLSARVGRFNPPWTELHSVEKENECFEKGMQLAGTEFMESVKTYASQWLPARSIVLESINNAKSVYETGEIIVLKSYCPWKSHLAALEIELGLDPLPKYVLYQDEKKAWRVQAVSVSEGRFESRKSLPAEWRGLRDEVVSQVTGIPGCIFVHGSGFIGGNQTFEGALEMAKRGLLAQE